MGAFFRTVFTMISGAALAGGGVVAATMFPQIREAVSGSQLLATANSASPVQRTPDAFEFPAEELSAAPSFQMQEFGAPALAGSAPGFPSTHPPATPAAGALDLSAFGISANTPASADAFLNNTPNTQQPLPENLDLAPPATPELAQPMTPGNGANWSSAIGQLRAAGVTNYLLLPNGSNGTVRCECWVQDGAVRRQLSGDGQTPADAVLAVVRSLKQFQQDASWLDSPPARSRP